jgi:hypothetical protein
MPPLEPRNHRITLERARDMIRGLRTQASPKLPQALAVNRGIIDEILAQKGCVGLRAYPALAADGTTTLVVVGIDDQGEDLSQGVIGEEFWPCPPWCASNSIG